MHEAKPLEESLVNRWIDAAQEELAASHLIAETTSDSPERVFGVGDALVLQAAAVFALHYPGTTPAIAKAAAVEAIRLLTSRLHEASVRRN